MSTVKATWQNGQVILEGKADWPEGHPLRRGGEQARERTPRAVDRVVRFHPGQARRFRQFARASVTLVRGS